jgi:peptidoglycan/LPS O-acetylase OafA/YrhL
LASGVTFFYVLSGFILIYVHPHLLGLQETTRFWISRLARIWPLHVVTLITIAIWQPFGVLLQKHFWIGATLNLLMLQSWIPVSRVALSFNGVSWSLSVELFFYLLFPFLLPLVSKGPIKMVIVSVILTVCFASCGSHIGLSKSQSGDEFTYGTFLLFCPLMHLYKFVFGMAIGILWLKFGARQQLTYPTWLEATALLLALVLLPASDAMASLLVPPDTAYPLHQKVQDFFTVPTFGILVYIFASQAGAFSKLFSHRWLVFLGEVSFSVYMLQGIVMVVVDRLGFSITRFVGWSVMAISLIACSCVTYLFIEKPARKCIVQLGNQLLRQVHLTKLAAMLRLTS